MGETLYEDGIIEAGTFTIDPVKKRITFKLNGKTYACFDNTDIGGEVKNILTQHSDKRIAIEYFDNVKGDRTYHNVTKMELVGTEGPVTEAETVQPTPQPVQPQPPVVNNTAVTTPKFFNPQAFGLACHLAQRTLKGTNCKLDQMVDEDWNKYDALVIAFYKRNEMIIEKLK